MRHASLLLNNPFDNFIQVPEGAVQNEFINYLGVLHRKVDGCYCPHAPPPHRQPLHIYMLVRLSQHYLGIRGLIDPVREVAFIAVAAADVVKGYQCYSQGSKMGDQT